MSGLKRIVIKRKRSSDSSRGAAPPKVVYTRPTVPSVRKRKSRGPSIVVGVVCALVALGAIWLLLNTYTQQQREVRIEELAIQALKIETEALYGRLPEVAAMMDGILDQADQRVEGVGAIMVFVTNTAAGSSVDAADAAPPHQAELMGIAREVAASRDSIYALQAQMLDRQPTLDRRRGEVMKAYRRVVAAAALAEIEKDIQTIDELLVEARDVVRQMDIKTAEAESIKEEEIRLREARAEAERRQHEAEALQRRIEDEIRQAAELVKLSKVSIRRFAFREALEPMENALAAFTTAPGRRALELPVERVQRLQSLKTHLIDGLNKSPFRWGWGTTAADSQDITGADEAGVKITTGHVEWKDVPIARLMKIIDHVGKTGRRLSSERASDNIDTAILLDEFGMKDQACERVREAIAINRHLAEDARRLLPDCK